MPRFFKEDKDAIIVLLAAVIICILSYPVINDLFGRKDKEHRPDAAYSHYKSGKRQADSTGRRQYYYVEEKQGELFTFDPNTADSTQLLRLGLRPWQVRNIYKYRAAGGRYRKPTDFARLYGLTLKQYKRLEPYIRIEKEVMAADVYGGEQREYSRESRPAIDRIKKLAKGETVNVNTADTAMLKQIPGIGSYYARQIVRRRERLGGFSSPDQLLEIDGFPKEAMEYLTVGHGTTQKSSISSVSDADKSSEAKAPGTAGLRKIRINHDDIKSMSRHPYMRYYQAKEIDRYRRLKGALHSTADLRRIPSFSPQDISRLTPYLDFE